MRLYILSKMTFGAALSLIANSGRAAAFSFTRPSAQTRSNVRAFGTFSRTMTMNAEAGQAEVVLVGCGAPNRGMGWYHGIQMVEKK